MSKPGRKADPNGNKPTVAEAKAAWEAHPKPSLNNVIDALHDAGFTGMSKSTLQRWHDKGWVEPQIEATRGAKNARKEAEKAEAAKIVEEVTEKTLAEMKKEAEAKGAEEVAFIKSLEGKAMSEIAELATKESLIAQIVLARRIQTHANMLVGMAPKAAAQMVLALKEKSSNVTLVMPNDVPMAPEDGPRLVNGRVIEHMASDAPPSPLQAAIREFKSKELKVVR
jgi:nucleotide-binding universal stress UspA family protein